MCKAQKRHGVNVAASNIGSNQRVSVRGGSTMESSLTVVVGRDKVLAGALDLAGWNVTKLGALRGSELEVWQAVALGLDVITAELRVDFSELQRLAELANAVAEGVWMIQGGVGDSPILANKLEDIQKRLDVERQRGAREKREALERLGSAPRLRWPSRFGRWLAQGGWRFREQKEGHGCRKGSMGAAVDKALGQGHGAAGGGRELRDGIASSRERRSASGKKAR
jgi:hypothetical protein